VLIERFQVSERQVPEPLLRSGYFASVRALT
jgi:hypothetical protein